MGSSFYEYYAGQTGLVIETETCLFTEETPYQTIEIFETEAWGRLLALDGMVMLSEKDEFVYHEMVAHVPLFTHPSPERVLIIGGGDGGMAREVLRHPGVRQVDLVEIDWRVLEAAQTYLPEVGNWDDPRLDVCFEDGVAHVQKIEEPYDVMIIDGSDAVGPAADLFDAHFWRACREGLAPGGLLVTQAGSPWIAKYHRELQQTFTSFDKFFELTKMYLASVPLYPAGLWAFALASKGPDPLSESVLACLQDDIKAVSDDLRYYNAAVHRAGFALPGFIKKIIKGDDV